MLANIALKFAVIIAVGTLEARLNAAFVLEMPGQVPFPVKDATTVTIWARESNATVAIAENSERSINI